MNSSLESTDPGRWTMRGGARATTAGYPHSVRWSCVVLLMLASAGCASPSSEFAKRAAALGMTEGLVHGDRFDHVVFRTPRPVARRLHVYLEGDGSPWLGGLPVRDPTPRKPLALALMALDTTPGLYLGRPCYHGVAEGVECPSALWTSERYSETVVGSMAVSMRRIVEAEGVDEIVWFGYSGGGTLAVLLAPRLPQSVAVITVAANLDIDAWADGHGDPRLTGSLNPARQQPLSDHIVQIHYAGGRDRLVPADIVRRGVSGSGRLVVVPEFDHVCCWAAAWPRILGEVERATRRGSSR
jgi:pimeloyl-ACP methyl ester carboxylesterase